MLWVLALHSLPEGTLQQVKCMPPDWHTGRPVCDHFLYGSRVTCHRSPCMHKHASYCKTQASELTWLATTIDNKQQKGKKKKNVHLSDLSNYHHYTGEGECWEALPTVYKLRAEKAKGEGTKITVNRATVVFHTAAKANTKALLRVSHSIIKHKNFFQDGEMIKEAFVEAADSLFQDFKNKYFHQSKLFSYQEVQLHSPVK